MLGIEQRTGDDRDGPTTYDPDANEVDETPTAPDGGETDAALDSATDAALDSGRACALEEPFGEPTLVVGPASVVGEFGATLSKDELELFFTSTAAGRNVVQRATRETRDGPFAPAVVVAELKASIPAPHWSLSLGDDDLTLYVTASDPPRELFRAERPNPEAPFTPAKRVVFADWDAAVGEEHVSAGTGGVLLLAVRNGTTFDLFSSSPGAPTGPRTPTALVFQSSPSANETWPVESHDGLSLFYAVGGPSQSDIFLSRRQNRRDPFPEGSPLPFKAFTRKHPVWVSPDGCRLYLVQDDAPGGVGDADLWVAARPR